MTSYLSIIQSLLRFLEVSEDEGFALVCQHGWKSIEDAIVAVFVPRRLLLDSLQMYFNTFLWLNSEVFCGLENSTALIF